MKFRLRQRLCVLVVLFVAACTSSPPTPAISATTSLRPPQGIAAPLAVGASATVTASGKPLQAVGFAEWVSRFREAARAAGIDEAPLHEPFDNVAFIPRVVDQDRAQPKFTRTVWAFLDAHLH